ncbi:hypothetical protein ACFL59_03000 [Planctomycetota bacterium]
MTKLRQLFILDPHESIHFDRDTSILLMDEAIRQGHSVWSCTEYEIWQRSRRKLCRARRHQALLTPESLRHEPEPPQLELRSFDVVHIRKDPPFDQSYVALLLLLQDLEGPLVVNNPTALLKYNEKTTILRFPDLVTDTLVASSLTEIESFVVDVGGQAVLKPLFSCSGRGVELLDSSEPSLRTTILSATADQKRKVMVQRFLPQVRDGETRIFMLDDRPLGVMKKVPREGSFKANFDFGARGVPYELNAEDRKLCDKVGTFCKGEGILLSALDVIDGHLSEINVTSPGLLVETNEVCNRRHEGAVIELLTRRLAGT